MEEISFRILLVPENYLSIDKNLLRDEVKETVEECDLEVVNINFFQVNASDEELHPEIEELILHIDARTGKSYPSYSYLKYKLFCKNWKIHSTQLPCSYIMMYLNESFAVSRSPCIDIQIFDLQFGVLPHDGYFHEYTMFNKQLSGTFYNDTRNAVIYIYDFVLEFSYDNIRNIFVNSDELKPQLFLDLYNPPIVFTVKSNEREELKQKSRNLDMNGNIDLDILGRANVLRFTFCGGDCELEKVVANIRSRCSSKPVFYSSILTISKHKPSEMVLEKLIEMEFACTYMITAIFKRNFVLMAQLISEIEYENIIIYSNSNPKALENALVDVLSALEFGKLMNYWQAITNRYQYYVRLRDAVDFKECIVPAKCFMTRRIIITPTRLMLWPPELLFGNRVIRKFDSDYAIRVSFRDDNMLRLTTVAQRANKDFMEFAIKRPLTNGILIGTRKYEFLAWSNSQLRDHNVWMYAEDSKGVTSNDIRNWMGEFSNIHNVPKYMARMGQCFSQTVDTISVPLEPHSVRTVPDITGSFDPENKTPYIFSDGIGRISTDLAAEVHEELENNKLCTALQIRYGGYKGMLVVDPSLKDTKIEFRESMKKFNCPNSTRLEIARTSAPVTFHLNRPLVAVLNDLGVRHRVFLRLQESMLKNLTDMLFEEEKAVECLKLKTQGIYDYEELSKSGIHLTTEKFFRDILLAVHRHEIGLLKSKARVSIDPDYARNMLGALDESGILNYGEVFVQYTKDVTMGQTARDTVILEGQVLITKSPCHNAGDARKFTAVDVPQLHHIVDCVVFPQTGPRPHPNEMAGADLDGDEFGVIWLKDLIFHCPNKPAAHFPNMKCSDKQNISMDDMIDYFQDYIKKDQVGKISSAHLALVDRYGVEADICKAVAKKVSIAVDFPKSGRVLPLSATEAPIAYPDFMEKPDRDEYKSQKALGKMFRICRDYEIENRETSIRYQPVKVDPDLLYPGWERYEERATESKKTYDNILCSLLRNYGIEHEAEVISGAFTDLHCRFQERNDRMDVMKAVIDCFKKLMSDTLSNFFEEFTAIRSVEDMDQSVLQKASAWYYVTYSDSNSKYLSFPWTLHRYLAIIKMRKTIDNIPSFSPAILEMDNKIEECERDGLLPDYKETGIWSEYEFSCPPKVVKLALKVLILWAREEEIIGTPGHHKGLLFTDTFIKLFLHVAKLNKYVILTDSPAESVHFSSAKLCIEFLKFCTSLRFYNANDIREVLPFFVYKHSKLAKRAVIAYHRFALSGLFRTLYFDIKIVEDLIDMNPFPVSTKLFASFSESFLRKSKDTLIKYSGAEEIRLRKNHQTKKIWVSAVGSERAIKELKSLMRKKMEFLRQLFITGEMPQEKIRGSNSNLENNNNRQDDDDDIMIIGEVNNSKRNNSQIDNSISKKTKY